MIDYAKGLCVRMDPDLFDLISFNDRPNPRALAACAACELRVDCATDARTSAADHVVRGGLAWFGGQPVSRVPVRRERCGSDAGYFQHRRRHHEPACSDCLTAHRDAGRRQAAKLAGRVA